MRRRENSFLAQLPAKRSLPAISKLSKLPTVINYWHRSLRLSPPLSLSVSIFRMFNKSHRSYCSLQTGQVCDLDGM